MSDSNMTHWNDSWRTRRLRGEDSFECSRHSSRLTVVDTCRTRARLMKGFSLGVEGQLQELSHCDRSDLLFHSKINPRDLLKRSKNRRDNMASQSNESKLDLGDLGAGLMQWGTTDIDDRVVNPKGNLTEQEVRDIWTACRKQQIVFFDTAEGYGGGTSETRIRGVKKWYEDSELEGKEDKVVVATKYLPTLWRWTKGAFYKSLHGSLDRLGVECIDLYFIHTPIHPLPIEYFIQWCCDAMEDGLIKHIGISNCNADLTRRAHAVAVKNGKRIACNQIMLNLLVWKSGPHQETVRACQDLGIQIAAYSPIGQGLLTDGLSEAKFSGIRAVKMTGVKYDALAPLRNEIERLSQVHKCTMAQVAINWVRGHGAVPLIGCRSVKQVEDAGGSVGWSLTPTEIDSLDKLSLGLSLFERPMHRRCLFVVFISLLQLAYYTEQRYKQFKRTWFSSDNAAGHEE